MSAALAPTPWMLDRNGSLRDFTGKPVSIDDDATIKFIAGTVNDHAALVAAVKARATEISLDAELAQMMKVFGMEELR